MTKLDRAKLNDIIRTFIQETLDFDEDVRTNRKAPFSLEEIDQRADFIGSLKAEKQEDLAKCDYRSAAPAVNTVIQNHDLNSEDYNRLSREILKAEIAMMEVEQKGPWGIIHHPKRWPCVNQSNLTTGQKEIWDTGACLNSNRSRPQPPSNRLVMISGMSSIMAGSHGHEPITRM